MTLDAVPKPRRLSTCHRHPAEQVTGVCALCLGERLTYLDSPGDPLPTSSAPVTAIAPAPEPIIPSSSGAVGGAKATSRRTRFPSASSSSNPAELSRSKSFSASKCGANLGFPEPRRKSCDVRVRSSLCQLFDVDDSGEGGARRNSVESKNLGFLQSRADDSNADQIRVSGDSIRPNVNTHDQRLGDVEEEGEDVKTMKELIELEWQRKKHAERNLKDIAGNIWVAASVFSQKLKKWKMKKRRGGGGGGGSQNVDGRRRFSQGENLNGGELRETQSEVGEYGCYGRRSCDTEPRFSVDAHRMSLDDHPRYSLDEPRASWDGYMVARTIPCLAPIISVTENVRLPPIPRSDYGVSIEEKMSSIMEDPMTSGGSAQTRDYGSDSSSSQRRISFDGSSSGMSSNKKTVAVEVDEMKTILHSKASPTATVYQSVKFVVKDRECRDLDFIEHKFDHSRKDDVIADTGGFKKSGRWRKAWSILGFKQRPRSNQCSEPARHSISEPPASSQCSEPARHSISEPPAESRGNRVGNGASDGKLIRSSSGSYRMIGSYRRSRSIVESRGSVKKNREESALERNRSARYSPSNIDNGLLRLYLTPLWNFRSKSGNNRLKNSHSAARGALPAN